uniref:ZSWIM4-8 C-terminal domain-containing protein n=1 Tax=Anopheles maculatus TaxID=74869 RepID=A0A182SUL4_9DIPT
MVNPAAELALSVLPHAAALNPNEIQRAILQCKEQSDRMLERACIMVETAAKGGGVYPEVLFQVSRYWYELYLRNTPGGDMESDEPHDVVVNLMQLLEPGVSADAPPIPGVPSGQPGGNGPTGGVPPSVVGGGGTTAQQPYPPPHHQPVSGLAPINMTPYGGYGYGTLYHHQNALQYAHPTNPVHQMYLTTPLQFQYPPPPPPGSQGGQPQPQPQPPTVGYGQQQQQPPQQPLGAINPAAVAAYQSMQQHGVPPQAYGTPPQYQPVPGVPGVPGVQPQGPPTNPGQMQPNLQQFYGGPQAAVVAAAMQHQQQLPGVAPVQGGGPPVLPPTVPGSQQGGGGVAGGPQGPAPSQQQQHSGNNMRPQHAVTSGGVGGPPYPAAYGSASGTGGNNGSSGGGQPVRAPRHPHHSNAAQLHYLLATYNAGMLALETLARRVHDDRPQAKYARNPPYGEDVKWLLRISKKLGTQYLHQFCVCVVNSIVSPFVLHEVAIESAHYLSRNNPTLVMHHLRSALTPLMSKCQSMYFQCIHQKLYHLTIADYEDFTSTILSARNAFQITPEGNAQFKDWLQSIKRLDSIGSELNMMLAAAAAAAAATAASTVTSNSCNNISNDPSYSISKIGTTSINNTTTNNNNGHMVDGLPSLNGNNTVSVATTSPPASTSSSCSLLGSANNPPIVSPSPGIIYDEKQLVVPPPSATTQDAIPTPHSVASSTNFIVSNGVVTGGASSTLRSVPIAVPASSAEHAVIVGSKLSTPGTSSACAVVGGGIGGKQQSRHVKLNVSQPPLAAVGKSAAGTDSGTCSRKANALGSAAVASSTNRTSLGVGGQHDTTQQRVAPMEVTNRTSTCNVVVTPAVANGANSMTTGNQNSIVAGGEESATPASVYYPTTQQQQRQAKAAATSTSELRQSQPHEQQSQRFVKQQPSEQSSEKPKQQATVKQQQQKPTKQNQLNKQQQKQPQKQIQSKQHLYHHNAAQHQQQSAAVAAAATMATMLVQQQQQQQQHYQQTSTVAVTSQTLGAPATMPAAGLGSNHPHAHQHSHAHLYSHAQQQHSVVPLAPGN